MGHANISTTMRYVHHIPQTRHAAELSAVLAAAFPTESALQHQVQDTPQS
jgi:hypothetical protein